MYRVTVRIESLTPRRAGVGGLRTEEPTPELHVQAKAPTGLEALDKAIRILTGERDALMNYTVVEGPIKDRTFAELKAAIDEDEPEDDEDNMPLTGRRAREAKARARMDED